MSTFVLDEILKKVETAPHGAASLVLYALMSTLEYEQAGCLFKLTKLRDLEADDRQLAYELMELMARGEHRSPAWRAAKARMDELIRAG